MREGGAGTSETEFHAKRAIASTGVPIGIDRAYTTYIQPRRGPRRGRRLAAAERAETVSDDEVRGCSNGNDPEGGSSAKMALVGGIRRFDVAESGPDAFATVRPLCFAGLKAAGEKWAQAETGVAWARAATRRV